MANFFIKPTILIFLFFFKFIIYNFLLIDTYTRINLNDNLIHFYSFFWTNFWYLFFFFFVIYSNFLLNEPPLLLLSFLTIYLFYLFELNFYFTTNLQSFFFNLNLNNFNFFLFNNINKYHPMLFYLSVFFFILLNTLSFYLLLINSKHFKLSFFSIKILYLFYLTLFPIFWSLFLGSWWAQQEGAWGGWWNWDSSETFGLLFLLISLTPLHRIYSFNLISIFIILNLYVFYVYVVFYVSIQLNFDITSHNFGVKFFYFFNNNLFLIELLSIFFIIILKLQLNGLKIILILKLFTNNLIKYKTSTSAFNYFKSITLVLIFATVLHSFSPLYEYFFWNFFSINLFNYEFSYKIPSLIFFTLLLLLFLKLDLVLFLNTPLFTFDFFNFNLLITSPIFISFFSLIHYFVTLFLFFNILSTFFSLGFFFTWSWTSDLMYYRILFNSYDNVSLDFFFVEYATILDNYSITIATFILYSLLKTFNYLFFFFLDSSNTVSNLLMLTNPIYSEYALLLESFYLNSLILIYLLLVLSLFYIIKELLNKFKNVISAIIQLD